MSAPDAPTPRAAKPRAFTLIELLIVVAIIAILAAIAVPNFLEAQTRSKVSRVKADMRTMATAVEAYHVDHNAYPRPANAGMVVEAFPATNPFQTRIPTTLTTPISYISSLMTDTFSKSAGAGNTETSYYHHTNRPYIVDHDASNNQNTETEFNAYVSALTSSSPSTVEFIFISHGPDLDHDLPGSGNEALYDPTNGSVSNGDIVYFGPGSGFRN